MTRLPMTVALSVVSLVAMAVSFGTQLVATAIFGAGSELDGYFAALTLPAIAVGIVGSALLAALIPEYSRHLAHGDRERAARSLGGTLIGSVVALFLAAALCTAFSDTILRAVFGALPRASLEVALAIFPILWAATLLSAATLILGAALQAERAFLRSAAAPLVSGVVALLIFLLLVRTLGVTALVIGGLAGAAAGLVVVARAGDRRWPQLADLGAPEVRRVVRLAAPLIMGGIAYQSVVLVDRYLAAALSPGSITYLAIAQRIAIVLATLTATGVSTIGFVAMSAEAAAGNTRGFMNVVGGNAALILAFVAPITATLSAARLEFVEVVFQRGRFSHEDATALAALLPWYLLAMIGMAIGNTVASGFYSRQRTTTPALMGIAAVVVYVAYMPWLAREFGATGIAAGVALYYLGSLIVLTILLARSLALTPTRTYALRLARIIASAALAGGATTVAVRVAASEPPWISLAFALVAGGSTYVVALAATRSEEVRVWKRAADRLLRGQRPRVSTTETSPRIES